MTARPPTSNLPALAGLVAFACYCNALRGELVFDDVYAVLRNPDVGPGAAANWASGAAWRHDFWGRAVRSPESHKSFRPLAVLSFQLGWLAHGYAPAGFHLANAALHATVTRVYADVAARVVRRFGPQGPRALPAGAVGALAGLHFATLPAHAEAVASVVGRCELLAALPYVLGLRLFLSASNDAAPVRTAFGLGLLAGLALLAKEPGLALLPVCLTLDLRDAVRLWRRRWAGDAASAAALRGALAGKAVLLAALGVLAAASVWVRGGAAAVQVFGPADNPAAFLPGPAYVRGLNYAALALDYLGLALHPWPALCCEWAGAVPVAPAALAPRNARALALGALAWWWAAASAAWVLRPAPDADAADKAGGVAVDEGSDAGVMFAAGLLAAVPFLPASNALVTVGFLFAERVTYLPSMGTSVVFAVAVARAAGPSRGPRRSRVRAGAAAAAAAALLAAQAARTLERNRDWRTEVSLFAAGVRINPASSKLWYSLGRALAQRGDAARARAAYARALRADPANDQAANNLGLALEALGRPEAAAASYRHSLRLNPRNAQALSNLGAATADPAAARRLLERAVALRPGDGAALNNLAMKLAELGLPAEAEARYREAIAASAGQDPRFLSNLAALRLQRGAPAEAEVLARSALRLDPRYGSAQQNLALAWRAGAPGRLEAIVAHCLGRGRPAAAAAEEEELAATSSQDCEVVEALARAGRLSVRGLQQQQQPRA